MSRHTSSLKTGEHMKRYFLKKNLVFVLHFWSKLKSALSDYLSESSYFDNEIDRENQVIRDAAKKLDFRIIEHGGGMLELRDGNSSSFFKGVITEADSAAAFKIAGDKYLTHILLRQAGLPVPEAGSFHKNEIDAAIKYFHALPKPLVVKPRRGTGAGAGITVGIDSEPDFITAFFQAAMHDNLVIVERFVTGEHYRVMVLFGKAVSVLHRIPATIVGDGTHSLKSLITMANKERRRERRFPEMYPIPIDDDLRLALRRQRLTLKSVPEAGQKVPVKTMCNYHQGGTIIEVIDRVHPDYLRMSEKAARVCRVNLAGVDLIAQDIAREFTGAGAAINEVNTTPSLYVHYQVQNQEKRIDVTEKFLTMLFQNTR